MNIDLTKIVSIDIETVPRDKDFGEKSLMFDTWKSKHRAKELSTEELIELYNTTAGLYGEYAQIVCISTSFVHEGKIYGNSYVGTEKEILDDLIMDLSSFKNKRGGLILLGANHINFDLPVIRMRYSSIYPLVTFPQFLSDIIVAELATDKPWILSEKFMDILQIHKGARYSYSSLAEILLSLSLPSNKLDTDGSQVAQLYKDGEIDRISNYCIGDTYASFQVLFTWLGQPIPELIIRKTKPKKLNVLQKIASDIVPSEEEMAILDARIENMEGEEKEIALEIKAAAIFRDKPLFR